MLVNIFMYLYRFYWWFMMNDNYHQHWPTHLVAPPAPNLGEHQGNTLSRILDHWMRSALSLDGRYAMYMDWRVHMTKNPQHHVTQHGGKIHMTSAKSPTRGEGPAWKWRRGSAAPSPPLWSPPPSFFHHADKHSLHWSPRWIISLFWSKVWYGAHLDPYHTWIHL